jgi:DnaJ-like protein
MLDFLVERRLLEAVSRGELENLPGEGRPLELDDDALIPEDLRAAYRILKNAGFVPPEAKAVRKLSLLKARMEQAYFKKAVAKLGR